MKFILLKLYLCAISEKLRILSHNLYGSLNTYECNINPWITQILLQRTY